METTESRRGNAKDAAPDSPGDFGVWLGVQCRPSSRCRSHCQPDFVAAPQRRQHDSISLRQWIFVVRLPHPRPRKTRM